MATFHLKYRDTRPVLEVTLLDTDATAHNLTGATGVKLHITLEDGTLISRDMVIDADPTAGIVRYTWLTTDWTSALVVGDHRMEYEVLAAASSRLTFPNSGWDRLSIVTDLGQG